MTKRLIGYLKPALLMVALFGFLAVSNGAWAASLAGNGDAKLTYSSGPITSVAITSGDSSGDSVLIQIYNIIRFAYLFFYAIAVLLVAQAWLQFKQQKYDQMFASMGAALGLFLTPAIIDFIHNLGAQTASA